MARRRNPARLIVALSVAAVLAVFLVYVAVAGGGTPQVKPSELQGHASAVVLTGQVVAGTVRASEGAVRFRLRDVGGTASVAVVYRDNPPDQFKAGRDLSLRGTMRSGLFVGEPGTMITKCPSKYSPRPARSREQG
ncbi:MAG: cytochrome c maturation protein CcmE [Gaiellaceae bacterium]